MDARRNAVPQIGPEVPPTLLVTTIATFCKNVATLLRSNSSHCSRTFSKPRAREYPKSPSPTTESKSQKYFSLSIAVSAMVRTTYSVIATGSDIRHSFVLLPTVSSVSTRADKKC